MHTPGPWVARAEPFEDGRPYYWIDLAGGSIDYDTKTGGGVSGLIHDADAHLIVAAPDLLAACKGLLAVYEYTADLPEGHPILVARAAVAKAEGN